MSLTWTKNRYFSLAFIAIASLSVGAIGYVAIGNRATTPPISQTPPKVESVSALGRLEPDGEVIQVFAPTSLDGARVESLKVTHGQQISKGEAIALLDTYARREAAFREAQEQVTVALSRLRQVEAGAKSGQIRAQARVVDRLQIELQTETATQEAAIARLEAELRNAELEGQRYQYLQTEGAVSASLRDSKRLTADTAQQRLQEAQAELSRIRRSRQQQVAEAQATLEQVAEVRPVDVDVAKAQVAQAEASLTRAKAELDLAIVRSPQDGQVLKIHTRAGELVGSKGVISLGQTQRMVAVAEVYELDISRIRIGQSAIVTSKNNAFPDLLRGKVVEVGLEINKKDVLNTDPAAQFDARVVEVKVLLDEASSRKVSGLTNLSIQVAIDVQS
ncbi:ABC exporter membrane fusion protein [Tumidithrix helvetica PCC 7403]|uniref:ABC exporter membrane fusion protein n=1 Tax=Tumidithrix helvetica TaxID=3457545 RepID=UPI003CA9E304